MDILHYLIIPTIFNSLMLAGGIFIYLKENFQKKKVGNKDFEIDEYNNVSQQIRNYLYNILGLVGANRCLLYKIRNGKVFLTKEGEYRLVLVDEAIDDYSTTLSVLRTHQPQQLITYGMTYIELKSKGHLQVSAKDNITKEYLQSHFYFITELQERGTEISVLFYLKSFKDSTPFGVISLEFTKGNKAQNGYETALYDIQKIVDKINYLLERIKINDN